MITTTSRRDGMIFSTLVLTCQGKYQSRTTTNKNGFILGGRSWPQYPSDGFTLLDCSVKKSRPQKGIPTRILGLRILKSSLCYVSAARTLQSLEVQRQL